MRDVFQLPKDPDQLAEIVEMHCRREEESLVVRRMVWLLSWYYMRGYRNFRTLDERTGAVLGEYSDEDGNLEFQSQELLAAANEVSGRISGMDVRPSVSRTSLSLGAIRSRSIMQVVLSAVVSQDQVNEAKQQCAWLYTLLGSCGLAGAIHDHPTVGLCADIEVVHPREILPFPSLGQDHTKASGLVRTRFVSLDYLEEKLGRKIPEKTRARMDLYEKQYGEAMEDADGTRPGGVSNPLQQKARATTGTLGGWGPTTSQPPRVLQAARVRELWQTGIRGQCIRYVITSGDALLHDSGDLSRFEVYPSLHFARFMENSSFHGAGIFDLLFGYSRQHEKLLASLFSNVHDADRYGIVVLPGSQMNLRVGLQDAGRGLRVLPWEPDPVAEGFRPFSIAPASTGDFPGKVAAMTKDLFDRLNPIRDLLREKGRVDSATGLQFLDEQVNRAMTNPTSGFQRLWGNTYRSIGQQALAQLAISKQPLPVTEITTDLAGIVLDPDEDTVSFKDNPLPVISRLSFGIRDLNPKSEVARKAEAISLMEKKAAMGRPDWDAFVLFGLKEGLDFAMWMEEERAAHESIVRMIVLLYGDGETPGEITLTPHTSRPENQLRELSAFMSSPHMHRASNAVINAFKTLRETLLSYMGLVLPAAVPNPEDAALLSSTAPLALPPGAPPPGAESRQPTRSGST